MPSVASGVVMIVIGTVLLFIGILSWFIYIPVFSWWYFGEIGGVVLIIIGSQQIKRAKQLGY